ncbi:phage baseplate assembly protein [Methylobacterium sp. V23]|uniref:phage baseplate assembly protein n=1 Tax=Methylobacterium sp. V23 TaxID=2044878 RepID=UPI000CDB915E|nr:hypothetical protein [Methylobacterium sp. V23]POR42668.1 hypothetical protein CRT23_12890 [Methylobacterium sp. V23]
MSDPDLICEVRTEGGTYHNWLSVAMTQSFDDRNGFRNFRLICAEPSAVANLRLKPGDRVDIALAGQVAVQEGYIVNRQAAYDANRHVVQIDGYSKGGQTTRASINEGTGQFRGYKLEAIANSVLKPHGIKFKVVNPPDGADEPFTNVQVRFGETPFQLISRLCNQRGLWISSEADGTMVAGADTKGGGVVFEEGKNILSANCSIAMPSVQEVIVNAQKPGSDSLFGRKAAEIQAKATMQGPKGQARKVLAEMPLSEKELKLRTNMEVQAIEASLVRVSITYQGWLRPGIGGLWELAHDYATIKSPMLFPTESGQMKMKLWSYVYSQSEAGTTTTCEFVSEKAFEQKAADATKNDGFISNGASLAVPETVT